MCQICWDKYFRDEELRKAEGGSSPNTGQANPKSNWDGGRKSGIPPLPASVRTDEFFEPPGMWDADRLLGPPKRNLGVKSGRTGRMDQSQVPRLPKTTREAFESIVPLFVPIIVNYEL